MGCEQGGDLMMQGDLLAGVPMRMISADAAIARGAEKATRIDATFLERAGAHMLAYLDQHGVSSGELLTDACKLAGITSTDDRHFGAVFRRLQAGKLIRWAGECRRTKGHATRGGSLYARVPT